MDLPFQEADGTLFVRIALENLEVKEDGTRNIRNPILVSSSCMSKQFRLRAANIKTRLVKMCLRDTVSA